MRFTLALVSMLLVLLPVNATAQQPTRPDALPENETPEYLRLRQAFYAANACDVAYLPAAEIRRIVQAMGVTKYQFLDFPASKQMSDTQVLVATLDSYTLVCFRGTQELADWRTNLTYQPSKIKFHEDFPEVTVHSGFYGAWTEVKPALTKYLDELGVKKMFGPELKEDEKCHELLIGGHSLGGALASIAGIDLLMQGYPVLGIYTFGQPKVFGTDLDVKEWGPALDFFVDFQRFVLGSDPIPSVPPGYQHFGNERYASTIGSLFTIKRDEWYWPSIDDHRMSNYLKTISAIIAQRAIDKQSQAILEWLKLRSAPLGAFLKLSPREAENMAADFSVKGGGGKRFSICGRRLAP